LPIDTNKAPRVFVRSPPLFRREAHSTRHKQLCLIDDFNRLAGKVPATLGSVHLTDQINARLLSWIRHLARCAKYFLIYFVISLSPSFLRIVALPSLCLGSLSRGPFYMAPSSAFRAIQSVRRACAIAPPDRHTSAGLLVSPLDCRRVHNAALFRDTHRPFWSCLGGNARQMNAGWPLR
jgi:hypothetical protein